MATVTKDDQHFDISGPIDLDALKFRVGERGPLTLFGPDSTLQINVDLFLKETETGEDDLFSVVLISGATTLSTLVSGVVLKSFQSLDAFAEAFFREPHRVFSPTGELSYIKDQIGQHLGVNVENLFAKSVLAEEIKLQITLSPDAMADPWMANNLQATLNALVIHRQMLEGVGQLDGAQTIREAFPSPNDLIELMTGHYNLGFLTARLVSENFTRNEIEPLALKGLASDAAQQNRTTASGKKSYDKRHQRIAAVLSAMEALCAENPSIGRFGIKPLADLAIKDCVNADPQLWKQGKGQRDTYLEEMKSDLRYQNRYKVLMSKTA